MAFPTFDQRHLLTSSCNTAPAWAIGGGTLLSGWKGALYKEWTVHVAHHRGHRFATIADYLAAIQGTGVTGSIRPEYTGAPLDDAPAGFFLNPRPTCSASWTLGKCRPRFHHRTRAVFIERVYGAHFPLERSIQCGLPARLV